MVLGKLGSESFVHARRQQRIKAPKFVSFPAVVRNQNGVLGGCGWSESDEGELSNKIKVMARPNLGEVDDDENGWSRGSFELNH